MSYNLSPIGECQFTDANGAPYSGAKLFIYTAGSSTKATTYQDNAGVTPHTNPIILNTKGEIADGSGNRKPIWLPSGASYKFILAPSTDTDPPTSSYWTIDNIVGINDTTVTISEWITGPTPTYVSATSLTLVGDQTSTFHVGRRIKTTNSGGTIYSTIVASVYTTLTTLTVVNDSGNLDSGLSAIYNGIISSTNTSLSEPASWGLISNDATATAGPTFTLLRYSASPAASDVLGVIPFNGRNTTPATKTYAQIQAEINDATAASEDGQLTLWTVIAGTLTKVGTVAQGLVIGTATDQGVGTGSFQNGVYEGTNKVSRGFTWLETQNPSASTTITFSSALSPGKRYRITGSVKVSSTDVMAMRFNGDSGANYGSTQTASDQTPAITPLASSGSTQIILSSGGAASDTITFSVEFETENGDNTRVQAIADSSRINSARTAFNRFIGAGFYDGAANLSSVTIFNYNAAGTYTGKLRLGVYEE